MRMNALRFVIIFIEMEMCASQLVKRGEGEIALRFTRLNAMMMMMI